MEKLLITWLKREINRGMVMESLKVKFVDFPDSSTKNTTLEILEKEFKNVEESDNPDFLFYSVFGDEHLNYDCVRIFWTGENIQPDFNICDYAIGFAHMSYEDRYQRIPLYYFYKNDYEKARLKHLSVEEELEDKKEFCNFIYSNSNASPERELFFDMLSDYKKVDSGGKYRNNIGSPVEDKYQFQKKYKFSIAFENSSTSGYTTEKILQAFSAGTIPIYWGNPRVAEDFNDKAFINCHAYENFQEVIEEIKKIDEDDELLKSYLMEPIGTEEKFPEDALKEYRNFIIKICRQNPQEAFRRNNFFWGAKYQKRMKKFVELERTHIKLKKIYSRIRKSFKK